MPENPYCSSERLFRSIIEQDGVFYRSQQRGDEEFTFVEKYEMLKELYSRNHGIFLQRYHTFISPCFKELFDDNDYVTNYYLQRISARMDAKKPDSQEETKAKNERYLQLLKLKEEGTYFSNEKMRERDPLLFEVMVGRFLNDDEKISLRPTVDRPEGTWSHMLQQFEDAENVSRRRKRQLENEWAMPCSSKETARFMSHAGARIASLDNLESVEGLDDKDEEALRATYPKHCAKDDIDSIMKKFRKTNFQQQQPHEEDKEGEKPKPSTKWGELNGTSAEGFNKSRLKDEDNDIEFGNNVGEIDEDEDIIAAAEDAEEYPQELMRAELVSLMEQRFLAGEDAEFYDYEKESSNVELDKIRERDLEDAYFDED
uniref:CCD97-like C-terminal domain-containing protein n=1 Tax=Panagrolaimus sp. ES5 TaxID=591445 RepID=A0AC34F110_9BILA